MLRAGAPPDPPGPPVEVDDDVPVDSFFVFCSYCCTVSLLLAAAVSRSPDWRLLTASSVADSCGFEESVVGLTAGAAGAVPLAMSAVSRSPDWRLLTASSTQDGAFGSVLG
jgi:hypothetical protein